MSHRHLVCHHFTGLCFIFPRRHHWWLLSQVLVTCTQPSGRRYAPWCSLWPLSRVHYWSTTSNWAEQHPSWGWMPAPGNNPSTPYTSTNSVYSCNLCQTFLFCMPFISQVLLSAVKVQQFDTCLIENISGKKREPKSSRISGQGNVTAMKLKRFTVKKNRKECDHHSNNMHCLSFYFFMHCFWTVYLGLHTIRPQYATIWGINAFYMGWS